MFIKFTLVLSYILHQRLMTILNMVVKSMRHSVVLLKERIDTFFHKLSTKYGQDNILDFFVANFLADRKRWIGNLLENDGKDVYLDYKKKERSICLSF